MSNHHNRKCKLFDIRKQLEIPSVQKNDTTPSEWAQALLDIKVHDRTSKWGIAQVHQHLANQGILMTQ